MSFDLRFCKKEGAAPFAPAELQRFCSTHEWFQEPCSFDDGRRVQYVYENTKTKTFFVLEYDDPSRKTADDETVTPAGFVETGLSFNMNFNRPPSYGREAMPIVVELMEALDVYAVDPQSDEASTAFAKRYDAEELIRSWDAGNVLISPTGITSRSTITRVKRYMGARDRIQELLGDAYYVPSLFYMRRTTKRQWFRSQRVLAVGTWTDGIPMLIPRCSHVMLIRLHGVVKTDSLPMCVVSYRVLMRRLRPLLEVYRDDACPGAMVIPMRHADAARDVFRSFTFSDKVPELKTLYYVFPRSRAWYVQRVLRGLTLVFLMGMLGHQIGVNAITQARDAWRSNNAADVVRYAKRALWVTVLPSDRAVAHYWFGVGAYRLGNLADAEHHEQRAIALRKNYAAPYEMLGVILDAAGKRDEAWGAARRAIELDPAYAWAQNLVGTLLLEDGHAADAAPYFAKAMQLDTSQNVFVRNYQEAMQRAVR